MLDPDADLGRRAWLPCPRCCDVHWRYLLANETRLVFLQCPGCMYRWWHDTEFGVGHNQPNPPDLLAA